MKSAVVISILGRNEIVREGLRRILIDQAFDVHEAVADPAELADEDGGINGNHLFIVDAGSIAEGVASCGAIRARHPLALIVLMADEYRLEDVATAYGAGIDGYLVKAISCEPLGGALRLIAMGEKVYPSQIAEALINRSWKPVSMDWSSSGRADFNLSVREIEILRCLVDGEANKVISRRLSITEATVKVHIKAILRKLRVANRTQAAIWAVTRGLNQDLPADPPLPSGVPARRSEQMQAAI